MPSLKRMRNKVDQTKVTWGDETLVVSWRPGMLTMGFYEDLAKLGDMARGQGATAEVAFLTLRKRLASFLVEWDLTEDDEPGSPMIELNEASMKELPDGLVMAVLNKVLEEGQGGEASRDSAFGGGQAETSATSQPGQHSFG